MMSVSGTDSCSAKYLTIFIGGSKGPGDLLRSIPFSFRATVSLEIRGRSEKFQTIDDLEISWSNP